MIEINKEKLNTIVKSEAPQVLAQDPYQTKLYRGARIILRDWLQLKPEESLLIATSPAHLEEARILQSLALGQSSQVDLLLVEEAGLKVGVYFDQHPDAFKNYLAIIGATDYSLVTTEAAKTAIQAGSKFLSLPLNTNNGKSLLAFDFLTMDTGKTRLLAKILLRYLEGASYLRVTTQGGTDLRLDCRGRQAGYFNGVIDDNRGFSSASLEVYVPICEDQSYGRMVVDGSLGYLGKVDTPVELTLEAGRITKIEGAKEAEILREYLVSFQDPNMYHAAEFGIGLNSLAHCLGNCYIEDESAFGTYHIGFGRNLALGGQLLAKGHFDLVTHRPNIYVDNRKIIEEGRIIQAEPQWF